MEQPRAWIATALSMAMMMVLVFPYNCMAKTNYTVGGSQQWNLGVNYATWATGKTFREGDSLIFKYTTVHDVLEVSKSAYDSCSTTNPTATNQGGSTTIVLASIGNRYFICGTAGHCAGGMKLAITVAAAAVSTTGPATSPPPPSTTTTKTPTSPPPPSSAAMAVSGVQIKEGVVLVGCLVLGALTVRML